MCRINVNWYQWGSCITTQRTIRSTITETPPVIVLLSSSSRAGETYRPQNSLHCREGDVFLPSGPRWGPDVVSDEPSTVVRWMLVRFLLPPGIQKSSLSPTRPETGPMTSTVALFSLCPNSRCFPPVPTVPQVRGHAALCCARPATKKKIVSLLCTTSTIAPQPRSHDHDDCYGASRTRTQAPQTCRF